MQQVLGWQFLLPLAPPRKSDRVPPQKATKNKVPTQRCLCGCHMSHCVSGWWQFPSAGGSVVRMSVVTAPCPAWGCWSQF